MSLLIGLKIFVNCTLEQRLYSTGITFAQWHIEAVAFGNSETYFKVIYLMYFQTMYFEFKYLKSTKPPYKE